jgi:hypothetical protein
MCDLLGNVFSSSVYKHWLIVLLVSYEFESVWWDKVVAYFNVLVPNCLGGYEARNETILCRVSRNPGRDLNSLSPQHEGEVLTIRPQYYFALHKEHQHPYAGNSIFMVSLRCRDFES